MNVLVVSQARAGVKRVLDNVLPRLVDAGVECSYLTVPTNAAPAGCTRRTLLAERGLHALEDTALEVGYRVLWFWARAYGRIEPEPYDVIWLHNPRLLGLAPAEIAPKLLITYHNRLLRTKAARHSGLRRRYYQAFGRIEAAGIRRFADARYTVVHADGTAEVTAVGVPETRVTHIGNGVDLDRFTPDAADAPIAPSAVRDRFGLATDPLLLFLGRLVPQKRPLALLEAFDHAVDRAGGDPALAIAGDGPLRARVERRARSIEGVTVLGYVPEEVKPGLYAAADAFVLPSAYEGEPLSLYEALAAGCPCLVSTDAALGFVEDHDCGVGIEFGSPAEAGAAIAEYLDRTPTAHAANARAYAEANLGWGSAADRYREAVQKVYQSTDPTRRPGR